MVMVVNNIEGTRCFEFILAKDTIDGIIELPIRAQIEEEDWNKWERAVSKNMSLGPKQRNENMVRDISECFDVGWLSIEHLEQIHNFIFKNI